MKDNIYGLGSIEIEFEHINFVKVYLMDEYKTKWNVYNSDFVVITDKSYNILNNGTIYRLSIYNTDSVKGSKYLCINKYVEAIYDNSITKIQKDKFHLEHQSVIVNLEGKEVVNFKSFERPYLQGDIIYSVNNKYYNIETGECYSENGYSTISSKDYIFIDNKYDNDHSKRGVIKVNKIDGSKELFK